MRYRKGRKSILSQVTTLISTLKLRHSFVCSVTTRGKCPRDLYWVSLLWAASAYLHNVGKQKLTRDCWEEGHTVFVDVLLSSLPAKAHCMLLIFPEKRITEVSPDSAKRSAKAPVASVESHTPTQADLPVASVTHIPGRWVSLELAVGALSEGPALHASPKGTFCFVHVHCGLIEVRWSL